MASEAKNVVDCVHTFQLRVVLSHPCPSSVSPSHEGYVSWFPWTSVGRVGEAGNLGPDALFRILSASVTALQPHIRGQHCAFKRWIDELKPSALALQEVRLATEAQQFVHHVSPP